jgi:hypothetical protein
MIAVRAYSVLAVHVAVAYPVGKFGSGCAIHTTAATIRPAMQVCAASWLLLQHVYYRLCMLISLGDAVHMYCMTCTGAPLLTHMRAAPVSA